MSKLVYNGHDHTIELVGADGKSIGKWTAYNNIDHAFAAKNYGGAAHLTDGSYSTVDTSKPHAHVADPNGPYGSHGIIRFNYPGHSGVGVHSGRANAKHAAGPQHATHGCIRTTDAAMKAISDAIASDAVGTVEVKGNSTATATHGAVKHGHKHAHHAPAAKVLAHVGH